MNVLSSGSKTRYRDSNSPFSSFTAIFSRSDVRLLKGLYVIIYFHLKVLNNKVLSAKFKVKKIHFLYSSTQNMRLGTANNNDLVYKGRKVQSSLLGSRI